MKFIFILIFFQFNLINAYAESSNKKGKGWRESYGGDSNIAEFKEIAYKVYYSTKNNNQYKNLIDYDLAYKTIQNVSIQCKSNLTLDGLRKSAINYPLESPQRIELDCERWETGTTINQKYVLATHEILPLLFIEDLDYSLSSHIIDNYFKSIMNENQSEGGRSKNISFLNSIINCDFENYLRSVLSGADPFKLFDGESSLTIAVQKGCYDIALDLIAYSVPFKTKSTLSPFFYLAIDSKKSLYTLTQKKVLMKKIIQIFPELLNVRVISRNAFMTYEDSELVDYNYGYMSCVNNSNPLHLLASVSKKYEYSYSSLHVSDKKEIQENVQLLIDLGFDVEAVNGCNKTAKELILKNNLDIKFN